MRSRSLTTVWVALLAGSALSAPIFSSACRAAEAPFITTSEPDGFSSLVKDQTLLVDVYFGGARRGEAMVSVDPETVRFLDVDALLKLFPELTERTVIEDALTGSKLSSHSELVCTSSADRTRCGKLSPSTIGVIFDRDRFRLEIFFNPNLLEIADPLEDRYLPEPSQDLSLVNAVSAFVSGRSGSSSDFYNLQDQMILSWGDQRIRGAFSYSNDLGLGADHVTLEWDQPELRYSAGALWSRGSAIAGQRKLLGVGIESQIDTRQDKEIINGNPIVVFLDKRGRVDLLRDGRLLSSAIYEAGNQQIDTSNLPEGSYEIVLRVEEAGQPVREERRFYTKSRRLPSIGRTDFYAFGGMLMDPLNVGSLDLTKHPFVQGGIAHRLDKSWVLDGTIQATDEGAAAEIGATFLTPIAQLRAALIGDTSGAHGAVLQLTSSGYSRFNFNFDIRHINVGNSRAFDPLSGFAYSYPTSALASGQSPLANDYLQLGGIASYSSGKLRFLATASYRDEGSDDARYSIGPSLEWELARRGSLQVMLRGDLAFTERGNSGFAGINVRLSGPRFATTAVVGGRHSKIADDELGEGTVAALAGALNFDVGRGEMAVGAGFEHLPRQEDVVLSSEFKHPVATVSGDLVRSQRTEASSTQYSFGIQSTLVAGGGVLRAVGRTTTDSMIITRISGARANDRFEVLVNEQLAGTITGSAPLELSLPSYRAYNLRVRPVGNDLVSYDSSVREVSLFPGAVSSVEWEATPVSIKLGRLVDRNGGPIAHATITGEKIWSQTDENGYFQIEISDLAEVQLTLADGSTFAAVLFADPEANRVAQVEQIVCCGDPGFRLSSREFHLSSLNGD